MLTNHKPSRMAAKAVQAAALIGGMGNYFIEGRNSAGPQKSGAGSASLEETHLRPGYFGIHGLKRHSVNHESGSEKLQPPFPRASAVHLRWPEKSMGATQLLSGMRAAP